MAKHMRLKSSRESERRKMDLAVRYAERGVATGGGQIGAKKARRAMEARNLPVGQARPRPSGKVKQGRRRTPPSTSPRTAPAGRRG